MRRLHVLASTMLVPLAMAPLCHVADLSQPLEDQQVRVTEHTLQPGQSLPLADGKPGLVVYFGGDRAKIGTKNASVRRGESIFLSASTKEIRNSGFAPLHFVRVAFLGSGSAEVWGMTGLPPNYKMVLDNRYARVYDIRIPAHFKEPRHTHHGRVVICLSGAKLEHLLPDGHVQPSTLTTGEVVWRPGQTHEGHNIGDTDLWAIAVEPK
jgi:quercetin dioxygenase-like cupin family protein